MINDKKNVRVHLLGLGSTVLIRCEMGVGEMGDFGVYSHFLLLAPPGRSRFLCFSRNRAADVWCFLVRTEQCWDLNVSFTFCFPPSYLLLLILHRRTCCFMAVFEKEAAGLCLTLWVGSYQKIKIIKRPSEEQDPPLSLCFLRFLRAGIHSYVQYLISCLMTRRDPWSAWGTKVLKGKKRVMKG